MSPPPLLNGIQGGFLGFGGIITRYCVELLDAGWQCDDGEGGGGTVVSAEFLRGCLCLVDALGSS